MESNDLEITPSKGNEMVDTLAHLRTIYDLKHCPRCKECRLRFAGDFGDEGLRFSCSSCNGWFSTIELTRLARAAVFRG